MSETHTPLAIQMEPTPNPASIRFAVSTQLMDAGTAEFTSGENAEASPLARRLFELNGVTGVLVAPSFVTVTIGDEGRWGELADMIKGRIKAHVDSGQPAVTGEAQVSATGGDDTVRGIIRVLEEEIRPAVAMDGGDVLFNDFTDGVVHLHLRGACSGCPSSLMTLKSGIERRLMEEFPEIRSVEAL